MPYQVRIAHGIAAVLLLIATLVMGQPAAGQNTPAATQQLIVKFKAGTEGDRAASQAMQDPAHQSIILADLGGTLSAEVDIPVRIAAVTSGREFVMSVDVMAVTSAVVVEVDKRPDVVRATVLHANDTPQLSPRDPQIEVEFIDDSAIAKSITDGWLDHLKSDVEARRLSEDILTATGVQLAPRPPRPIVLFTLGVNELTLELAERLKKHGDVEYVELVRLLQPLPQ